jgi:hypothetical protein
VVAVVKMKNQLGKPRKQCEMHQSFR